MKTFYSRLIVLVYEKKTSLKKISNFEALLEVYKRHKNELKN